MTRTAWGSWVISYLAVGLWCLFMKAPLGYYLTAMLFVTLGGIPLYILDRVIIRKVSK